MSDSLQSLLDREAIRDCLYRYCRGIDRADEAALRSAYWPDAHDSHGAYVGSATGFIEWAMKVRQLPGRHIHHVGNILIELQGGTAAVESYFLALQRGADAQGVQQKVLLSGRYLDRFEKRGAEWRIAERTVVYDWVEPQGPEPKPDSERFGARQPIGGDGEADPLYAFLRKARG